MSSYDAFRDNVRKLLAQKGWTQSDLAQALGVDSAVVSRVMRGSIPTLDRLDRWAAVLEVPPSKLLMSATRKANRQRAAAAT